MFLKFWIISTIICLICLLTVITRVCSTANKTFTKEQRKQLKKIHKDKKSKYPWFIIAFIYLFPVVNIIFILLVGFYYEELEKSIIHDWKVELDLLTPAEKISDALKKLVNSI